MAEHVGRLLLVRAAPAARAMKRLLLACARALGWPLLGLSIAAVGVWCVLALAISGPPGAAVRYALAAASGAVALAALIALMSRRWRWRVPSCMT